MDIYFFGPFPVKPRNIWGENPSRVASLVPTTVLWSKSYLGCNEWLFRILLLISLKQSGWLGVLVSSWTSVSNKVSIEQECINWVLSEKRGCLCRNLLLPLQNADFWHFHNGLAEHELGLTEFSFTYISVLWRFVLEGLLYEYYFFQQGTIDVISILEVFMSLHVAVRGKKRKPIITFRSSYNLIY